jgi:homoserine O-acetyltransferase
MHALCIPSVRALCLAISSVVWLLPAGRSLAAEYPAPKEGDYIIKDFRFRSGETLPEVRIHYRTIGQPQRDASGKVTNAVLIMHGTTGTGGQFINAGFAGELFGKGQLLDGEKYFLIIPDDIGHGASSKPSDGLHAKFPRYGYLDMIDAEHRLVADGLKVNHLRLVFGTSMGGMHTWLWGEQYPDFMDALMPMASLPEQISGRNRMWRQMIAQAIRNDPQWKDGEYTEQPPGLKMVAEIMDFMGSNPALHYRQAPTGKQAEEAMDRYANNFERTHDANDVLYAFECSRDYDPGPDLEKITAPLLAINSADDLINPPDLGILERNIKRVKNGRAITIPEGPETRGHGTHTRAVVWKQDMEEFLKQTEPAAQPSGADNAKGRGGAAANQGPWGPAELPGKGLAQHSFLYAGEGGGMNIYLIKDGKVAWSYSHPGRGEISDATMLSNGNILFAHQFGVTEVSPDKKIVWNYDAPAGTEIHTAQPIGAERMMMVQNGDPAKLLVVNKSSGATEKEFVLPTANPKNTHPQFRHARVTSVGTFLVAHMDMGKVVEYDKDGKEIWSVAVPSPWAAARLKNGNTLVTSNRNLVREVNPAGETVWELKQSDVPDIRLFNTQTACRLASGNTIVNNWRTPQGGNQPVQLLEVTPDKKLVWAVRSWDDPNLGPSTNIQVLDEPGAAEKAELQR